MPLITATRFLPAAGQAHERWRAPPTNRRNRCEQHDPVGHWHRDVALNGDVMGVRRAAAALNDTLKSLA